MKKTLSILFTYLTLMNGSVYAEDDSYKKFSGAYIGGSIGAINAESKSVEKYEGEETGYTNKNKPEGLKVGGLLGYNYVTSKNILFGIEANYHFYGADDETNEKYNGVVDESYLVETNIKQKATLKARLGYVFNNEKTLAFLTGGYATSKIKTRFEGGTSYGNDTETKWHEGYLVGGGIEHFVNEKLTARVEYNYIDYNNEKIDSIYDSKFHNRIDEHSIQVGLIYHFKK